MKIIKKQLYVIFRFLRSELESPVFYEKIFSVGQDWRSWTLILITARIFFSTLWLEMKEH